MTAVCIGLAILVAFCAQLKLVRSLKPTQFTRVPLTLRKGGFLACRPTSEEAHEPHASQGGIMFLNAKLPSDAEHDSAYFQGKRCLSLLR